MQIVEKIFSATYKRGLGLRFTENALICSLCHQAARDGRLRIYVLYAGSEPVAFEVGCVYGKVYFAEQAGFDPRWRFCSPGTILQLKIFEQLTAVESVEIYDYGFGDAPYKQRFGSGFFLEAPAYLFAPRFYPVLINILNTLSSGFTLALTWFLHKIRLFAWIKRFWRRNLQKAVKQNSGAAQTIKRACSENETPTKFH